MREREKKKEEREWEKEKEDIYFFLLFVLLCFHQFISVGERQASAAQIKGLQSIRDTQGTPCISHKRRDERIT